MKFQRWNMHESDEQAVQQLVGMVLVIAGSLSTQISFGQRLHHHAP